MAKSRKASKIKSVLAAIFLVPIIFIVYFFVIYSSKTISLENINNVTVLVNGENSASFDTKEDIDFYVDMLNSSLSINSAMRDVSQEKPVYITCKREDKTIEYRFYPSLNLTGCLLVSPEGELYVLQNETAKQLLLRDEFSYLYSSYFMPTLSIVTGVESKEIYPIESQWNYYKTDGVQYSYTPPQYANGEEIFTIYKGFENKLQFSKTAEGIPYELTDFICISEDGVEHKIKDVSELDFSVDTIVSVSFVAKWSGRNGAQASGQAKYSFNVYYDIPSTLTLDKTEYTCGEVIQINASNLNPDEKVNLETLLKYSNLRFDKLKDGEGIGFIPVGIKNAPGDYTLSITTDVGGISEKITVNAIEGEDWVPFSVTKEEYDSMLSLSRKEAFEKTLADLTATRLETNYFTYGEDKFGSPVNDKAEYNYGQTINLGLTDVIGDSGERTVEGMVYLLDEGTSVKSVQKGKVVFNGVLAPTGKTLIIYHGYGIYSYYYHLDSAAVSIGDEVDAGQEIGIAGTSGYTNGKTALHYCVSIDNVFVNPQWFD